MLIIIIITSKRVLRIATEPTEIPFAAITTTTAAVIVSVSALFLNAFVRWFVFFLVAFPPRWSDNILSKRSARRRVVELYWGLRGGKKGRKERAWSGRREPQKSSATPKRNEKKNVVYVFALTSTSSVLALAQDACVRNKIWQRRPLFEQCSQLEG